MGLKCGEYVIINDYDCPNARLVAVLTCYDDKTGFWRALYLSKSTTMTAPYGERPIPLKDFGRAVEWHGSQYRVVETGQPCTATYRDGKSRQWQGSSCGWLDARENVVSAIGGMAA